jgi:Tripartite tricarboxylate transporter family receptor
VVRGPADGYTLIQLNVANAINVSLYDKLSFDVLRDLVPVASFMRVPNVMEASPTLPVKTVRRWTYTRQTGNETGIMETSNNKALAFRGPRPILNECFRCRIREHQTNPDVALPPQGRGRTTRL